MLIKIVNENRGFSEFMTLGDIAGRQQVFTWNALHGAYVFEPANQDEADAMLATNYQFTNSAWRVSVIFDSVGAPPKGGTAGTYKPGCTPAQTAKIPPFVNPALYEQYPLEDLLLLCADAGFAPEGDLSTHGVKHQLHRYYEGRAWAAEEMRRLHEEITNRAVLSVIEKDAKAEEPVRAAYAGKKRGPKPKKRAAELATA